MMGMLDGGTTSRYPRNLKAIRSIFIILVIFCIAECTVGSCLSYGHSCWGAHGKRSSEGTRISQYRQIRDQGDGRGGVEDETDGKPAATSDQSRWLSSRLVTGRLVVPASGPIVGKRPSNRWRENQSIHSLPGNWDTNYYGTNTNEIFRNRKKEITDTIGDSDDSDDSLELRQQMAKERDEATDLLYVPFQKEYVKHHPSLKQKYRLYKILTDSFNDDTLQ